MKKIIIVTTLLIAGVGVWNFTQKPSISKSNSLPKTTVQNKTPPAFDAAKAKEMGLLADRVAQAKMPEVDVATLSKQEVDAKLKEIDEKLANEDLVQRINQNQLSEAELVEVRTLLHLRAKYFTRRVQLALQKT
jgi:hypothetical protein